MTSKPTPPECRCSPTRHPLAHQIDCPWGQQSTEAKPGMAMPLGASQSKDDRDEKNRQLARLGAAMPKVIGR